MSERELIEHLTGICETFAYAYNEAWEKAWEEKLKHNIYLVQPEHPERTVRICNVGKK